MALSQCPQEAAGQTWLSFPSGFGIAEEEYPEPDFPAHSFLSGLVEEVLLVNRHKCLQSLYQSEC